jgi:hypothetical protein
VTARVVAAVSASVVLLVGCATGGAPEAVERSSTSTSMVTPTSVARWSSRAAPTGPVTTRDAVVAPVTIVFGTGHGPASRPNSLEPMSETRVVPTAGCLRVRFAGTARLVATSGRSATIASLVVYGPGSGESGPQRWAGAFVPASDDPFGAPPTVGAPIPVTSDWITTDQTTVTVAFRVSYASDRSTEPFVQTWTLDRLTMDCEAPA